ncbi:MAG TPA: lamin tail domain-containing protein [Candidatus Eisenbacteria bacterium]|nr:lamin tail domain-containing protein [Candidatus Eisenbacteria bacterium]
MKRLAMAAYVLVLAVVYSLALASWLASAARGDLVLNEILYDPDGADEGREFVELWNPDTAAVSLENVTLEACDGARPGSWSVVWRGAVGAAAPPRAAYLVPAVALTAAIQNGPDALRLARGGAVIDLLGYGDLEDASLREGEPAADAAPGQSLARVGDGVDTGVNGADWAPEQDPTPGEANHPDLRLRFTRATATVVPEVAWPGEAAEARVWVRNSGTRTADAARWAVVASMSLSELASVVTAPGASVAPGESVLVKVPLAVTASGLWSASARLEGAPPGPEAADTATAVIRCVAGPVVVTEFAYRDAGAGEWVEVWFREPLDDLALVSLGDDATPPRALDRGPVPRAIAAATTIVIAQDPAAVRARFALPESLVLGLQGGWPSLNDGSSAGSTHADRVRVLVDALPSDAVPYAGDRSARGGSVERLSTGLSSASPGTWSETIDPTGGTPGRANSVRAPERGEARGRGLLVASARVIRARDAGGAGGSGSPVVFRVTEEALGKRLTVRVHDLLGREVRTLVEGQRFPVDAAFVWDGRDGRGTAVAPGLYVVRAEALPDDAGAARSSSVLLAVAAGAAR